MELVLEKLDLRRSTYYYLRSHPERDAYAEYRAEGKPANPVAKRKSFVSEGMLYETEETTTPADESIASRQEYQFVSGDFGTTQQKT